MPYNTSVPDTLLKIQKVAKSFPGVRALEDVDFDVQRGEVHILLGENGAGKSTLIKILSGVYRPDRGVILYKGHRVHFNNPGDSQQVGISVIYQEPNLVPYMNVTENIHLGNEPGMGSLPNVIDEQKQITITMALFDELNLALDPYARVSELSLAEQHMVAIARALHQSADLVIMDEPTSSLSQSEVSQLFSVVRRLRAHGLGIVYVTHRLEEALQIGDRATILRDGQKVTTLNIDETSQADLIRMIVGRGVEDGLARPVVNHGPEILRLEHVSSASEIQDISVTLHAGEILGVTGLIGAGGTNLLRTIFGVDPVLAGSLFVDGQRVKIASPQEAIALGIGFLTEDRQGQGLVLEMNGQENMTMASLDDMGLGPLIDHRAENNIVQHYARRLKIRPDHLLSKALFLSGGTQQKLILSRWLTSQCRILLLDEPTRGIDVGARAEVYRLLNELTRRGLGMILVSSNLPEILGLSDRIAVLRRGQIVTILPRSEATPAKLLSLANGGMLS
ncbi:MAG TPA: sugar ABC transporter ATP-binding protein [Anaerolineales bacterium]|nr:sugar ABC transporter ATP-binding protein [Anaerolineales bacterium]